MFVGAFNLFSTQLLKKHCISLLPFRYNIIAQQKFTTNFSSIVCGLGISFSVLIVVYSTFKIYNPPAPVSSTFYYTSILLNVITAMVFSIALILNGHLKVILSVILIITGISIYGFEIYSTSSIWDLRTQAHVLKDLNDSGIEAYPNVRPGYFPKSNGLKTVNGRVFPLGGISNVTTIFQNESGYYPIIETDEHGFNNPKGLYKKNRLDIVLLGDSFSEGKCVHSDESISAVLREPGFNTLSIGKGGNGPLIEFAALKEYAEPLKPKIVLWVYFINDLDNLRSEENSSILNRYINEDDFSQNLMSRQAEIDSVLTNYVWENRDESLWGRSRIVIPTVINILKLSNFRTKINLIPSQIPPIATTKHAPESFKNILEKSKKIVSRWGGKLYFVYLPSNSRYTTGREHSFREDVLDTVSELGIPFIDIHREVFEPHPAPSSLFPLSFGKNAHYTAVGYRLVAEAIANRLEADGIILEN